MSVTRHQNDFNHVIEFTEAINEVENQYGMLNAESIFQMQGTSQTAIIFDKNKHTITLLPDSSRSQRDGSYGKDRDVETFSLPLGYFNHFDNITPEDIQGWRRPGTPDDVEALERVREEKLTDMRLAVDQTHEYMKIQAIKGVTTTPSGRVLADMPTEFGLAGNDVKEIDFLLGTSTTNVDAKVAELKRHITNNLKGAGPIQGFDVLVHESFFDKLKSHAKVKEVYLNAQSNQRYQDDLSRYMTWGISDVFVYQGVRFMTYPAIFNMPDGTTETAFEVDQGYSLVRARGMYRGYFGPSNKLTGANKAGMPMFAWEYRDPKDEFHELQVQTAPLFFVTKPGAIVRVVTSN